jgi:antirestriction protein ArdC
MLDAAKVNVMSYGEFIKLNQPVKRFFDLFCEENMGFYDIETDTIIVNESYNDNFVEVVLHELIHAMGHKNRLNRPIFSKVNFEDKEFHTEEATAYLGTLKLANHFDLDLVKYGNSTLQYIKLYPKANLSKAEKDSDKSVDYLFSLVKAEEEVA